MQVYCSRECACRGNKEREELRVWNDARDVHDDEYEPTGEVPGSEGKIEVMRQRAERGEPLYHPRDVVTYEGIRGFEKVGGRR